MNWKSPKSLIKSKNWKVGVAGTDTPRTFLWSHWVANIIHVHWGGISPPWRPNFGRHRWNFRILGNTDEILRFWKHQPILRLGELKFHITQRPTSNLKRRPERLNYVNIIINPSIFKYQCFPIDLVFTMNTGVLSTGLGGKKYSNV